MYRHQQQNTQYTPGTAGWYPQTTQQYLPTCMGDVEPHSVGTHWPTPETHKYLTSHHPAFTSEWPQDCNHFQVRTSSAGRSETLFRRLQSTSIFLYKCSFTQYLRRTNLSLDPFRSLLKHMIFQFLIISFS